MMRERPLQNSPMQPPLPGYTTQPMIVYELAKTIHVAPCRTELIRQLSEPRITLAVGNARDGRAMTKARVVN